MINNALFKFHQIYDKSCDLGVTVTIDLKVLDWSWLQESGNKLGKSRLKSFLMDEEKKGGDNSQDHNTWKFHLLLLQIQSLLLETQRSRQYLILRLCLLDRRHEDIKEEMSFFYQTPGNLTRECSKLDSADPAIFLNSQVHWKQCHHQINFQEAGAC